MTELELEGLADEVRAGHELADVPINPAMIAGMEGIVLLPGSYDDCFDGRIEYRRSKGRERFYLFYAEPKPGVRPEGRVRFSIAHELGHFYIPAHRQYLLTGHWHGSRAGFVSDKPWERQADQFAAALLMPRQEMKRFARKHRTGCSLQDLARLADETFETSLLSTVIRYVQLDFEPCAAVLSSAGQVRFCFQSDSMREMELGWLEKSRPVPAPTVTRKVIAAGDFTGEGSVDSEIWFEGDFACNLWEETLVLGQSGYAITFLVAEDEDGDPDDED